MLFLRGFFSQGLQSKGTCWGHKANGKEKEHPTSSLITFTDVSASEDGKRWHDDIWVTHNGSCEAFSCDIFLIYNITLTVMSTQQSVLGFQKMLGTETKILNVKSPSWTCVQILLKLWYWQQHWRAWGHHCILTPGNRGIILHRCFILLCQKIKWRIIKFTLKLLRSYLAFWFYKLREKLGINVLPRS